MGRPKGSKNKKEKTEVKERKRRRTKKEMDDARTLEAMRGQREAKAENGNREEAEERLPAPPPPIVKYDGLEATITGRYSLYDTGAWIVKSEDDEHGMEVHPFYLHKVIKDILDTTNLSSSDRAIARLVTNEEFGKYLLKVVSKKIKEKEIVGSDIVIKEKDLEKEEIIKLVKER